MKAVIQRVLQAQVIVDNKNIGQVDHGLLVFLGVAQGDSMEQSKRLAYKTAMLRCFNDDQDKMNLSLKQIGGKALVISQFTLYGDCQKGHRPSFVQAESPDRAEPIYQHYVDCLRQEGIEVECGKFGAMMQVELVNNGPVTLVLEL